MFKRQATGTGLPSRETPDEGFVGVTSHNYKEALHLCMPVIYTMVRTLIWDVVLQRKKKKKSFHGGAVNPSALCGIFSWAPAL